MDCNLLFSECSFPLLMYCLNISFFLFNKYFILISSQGLISVITGCDLVRNEVTANFENYFVEYAHMTMKGYVFK